MSAWAVLGGIAAAVWVAVALLPWQPHRTRERLAAGNTTADLSDVTVLIPARNEAEHIAACLDALTRQGVGLHVIVVDDESEDTTAEVARRFGVRDGEHADSAESQGRLDVEVVSGRALPEGWGGKLWALQQGLDRVTRPWCLLLDADIVAAPHLVPALRQFAVRDDASLVSVMAKLRCRSVWEKLLVPPFIFFFKLLYPFALVASRGSSVAAAAGGCILARTSALREAGAFADFADALIDDCTLARKVKDNGHSLRLCMSHDVVSLRAYSSLAEFWNMVSRTAFTQLRYSSLLLVATTIVMLIVFIAPLGATLLADNRLAAATGSVAIIAMVADFSPVSKFYRQGVLWRLTLPLAALLFLAMTWHSALNYYAGTRAVWKSRRYGKSN